MKAKIEEARIAKGVSQTELAKRTGLSRPYLSQLESGVRNLSARRQAKIAEALGVDARDLIDFRAPDPSDEDLILTAFRTLRPEQRRAWLDMARVAIGQIDRDA